LTINNYIRIIYNKMNIEYKIQNTKDSGVSNPLRERQDGEGGDQKISTVRRPVEKSGIGVHLRSSAV
jgi:hypothetical protein